MEASLGTPRTDCDFDKDGHPVTWVIEGFEWTNHLKVRDVHFYERFNTKNGAMDFITTKAENMLLISYKVFRHKYRTAYDILPYETKLMAEFDPYKEA